MSNKVPYNKPAQTYQEQIDKLKSRGLHFDNEDRAYHLLQHLSYYRFSAYLYPLLEEPKKTHKFKEGASFGQAFDTERVNPRRVYFMLAMIRYMLFTINPSSKFSFKIQQLLKDHPTIDPQALLSQTMLSPKNFGNK